MPFAGVRQYEDSFNAGNAVLVRQIGNPHTQFQDRSSCPLQESDSVRSALMMEQAALYLLQIAPPGLRKFAFTMVLAGLKYLNFSQRTLGIRCYMYVLD